MRSVAAAWVGLAVLSSLAAVASAQDMYCGDNNCYDGKLLLLGYIARGIRNPGVRHCLGFCSADS